MSIDEKSLDSEQKPDPHGKAKSYFGLLIALTFLIVMHLQIDFRQLGKFGGFFQKTFINGLVWSEGRGSFVRNYERAFDDCDYARQGVVKSNKLEIDNALRRMSEACGYYLVAYYSLASFERIQAFDPEYEGNVNKYRALLRNSEEEKTNIYSNPQAIDIAEKLSISLRKEYVNAQLWLNRMNIFAHLVVIILSLLGLRYRRGLGNLASAPIRWVASAGKSGLSVAKGIHNKI